jgi:hypothetical protein
MGRENKAQKWCKQVWTSVEMWEMGDGTNSVGGWIGICYTAKRLCDPSFC